jgi:hypothetical protein
MFYLKGKKMTEIAAGLGTLTLFLMWRLFTTSRRAFIAETMLKAIIDGKVVITKTKDGIELEITTEKQNG